MNVEAKSTQFNIQSTAFLGAIAQDRGLFYWNTYDRSVNTKKFIRFLRQLRKRHGKGRFYLYMDNLNVHKANASKAEMEELDIFPMWAPIYSPDYNPIEMMFSKLKGIVKRMRLKDMLKEEGKTFPELLIGATK